MLFKNLVEYSDKITKVSSRNAKIDLIVSFLQKLNRKEAEIGVQFISGSIRQGKLNITWQGLHQLLNTAASSSKKSPQLTEVDHYCDQTKSARGHQKIQILSSLFSRLTQRERKYLVSLIVGDVQQGAGEGLVRLAIARYFKLQDSDIEYASMRKPDVGKLFLYLSEKGTTTIRDLGIQLLSPVKPMLAEIAQSIDDVFDEYTDFAIEYKFDGVRIQVHKQGDEVKIFSRHLKDITLHFPELIGIAQKLPMKECILDGEAVGIGKDKRPLPFQILARRTTRKKDIAVMRHKIPVMPLFFDILYCNGTDLTSQQYQERWRVLNEMIGKKDYVATRILPKNKGSAETFLEKSVARGNEGIMVKMLDSPYRPGRRGKFWLKIKRAHTVDCIILAAEWGHGRRRGWLSNLHLGVLDETKTKFLMVGKTFKGLTDKMLIWLTTNLPRYKVHEDSWTVYVKPAIVVEIAFNEIQKSPRYESGIALRFARVKRIREDKKPHDINTIVDLEKLTRVERGK